MPQFYRNVPVPIRRLPETNIFNVAVVIGGLMQVLLRCFFRMWNAFVLAFDNQREVTALRQLYAHRSFQAIALGRGMTTHSLQQDGSPEAMAATLGTANTGVFSGFNGIPAHARRAAELFVASREFEALAASLLDEAIIRTNGDPAAVRILEVGGESGATNAGAKRVILDALIAALAPLGVEIHTTIECIGATTLTGRAVHGRMNYSESLLSNLRFVTEAFPASQLVTKELAFCEAPPFLDDTKARTEYLIHVATANSCIEMADHLALTDGNHRAEKYFGAVKSREVDLMKGLDREREIAPLVARSLRDELRELLVDVPADPLLIDELRWQDDSVGQERSELDDLIERADMMDADDLVEAITTPPSRSRFRLFVDTAHGGEFEVERMSESFSRLPDSVELFRQRLTLIETFAARLTQEVEWVQERVSALEEECRQLATNVRASHAKLVRMRQSRRSKGKVKLLAVARPLRTAHDQLAILRAEADALERGLVSNLHERDHHRSQVAKIDKMLDSFVPRGSMQQVPNYVSAARLSKAFPNLLKVLSWPRWEQLDELCSAAGTVRCEGLAKIVKASSDRTEDLAEAIVHGHYDIIGPPLGAFRTQRPGELMYVLPPMDPEFEQELAEDIRRRDTRAKVLFSDTLTFGATVMRIRLHRYTEVSQFFEGMAGADVAKALESPLSALISPDNHAGLKHFGGRIENNRVVFPRRDPSLP